MLKGLGAYELLETISPACIYTAGSSIEPSKLPVTSLDDNIESASSFVGSALKLATPAAIIMFSRCGFADRFLSLNGLFHCLKEFPEFCLCTRVELDRNLSVNF